MADSGSTPDQPARIRDLAALRRAHPGWQIDRGTGSDPRGYSATRDGCLITAPSLDRLGDLLAGAAAPADVPPDLAALAGDYPRWSVWRSDEGRVWATRALAPVPGSAACGITLDADTPEQMRHLLAHVRVTP
jgi:hypothetical protein